MDENNTNTPQGTGEVEQQTSGGGANLLEMLTADLDSHGEQPGRQEAESSNADDGIESPAAEKQEPVDEIDELAEVPDDDDEETEQKSDDEGSKKYRFKLRSDDAEEIEVTQEELFNGYRRQQDYTKGQQALAEERKKLEAEVAGFSERQKKTEEMEQAYSFMLTKLRDVTMVALRDFLPSAEEMQEIRTYDPESYLQYQEKIARVQQRLNLIDAERKRIANDQSSRTQEGISQVIGAEAKKILEARPEWANAEKRTADAKKIVSYAKEIGFGDEDLNNLIDHRAWIILDEARRYREIVARRNKLKTQQEPSKKVPGGSNGTPAKGAKQVAKPADVQASLGYIQKNPDKPGALAGFLLAQGVV